MKIYAKRNGIMVEAEVEDGSIYLEIGSTDSGNGNMPPHLMPIVMIDEDTRTFRRRGEKEQQPFPERFHREAGIHWMPSPAANRAELALQEIQ